MEMEEGRLASLFCIHSPFHCVLSRGKQVVSWLGRERHGL